MKICCPGNQQKTQLTRTLLFDSRLPLKRLGVSYKKTRQHPKANEKARIKCKEKTAAYEAEGKVIIYINESGFTHEMPRTHSYSGKGERCYGAHNWNTKGRTNVIGAIVDFVFLTLGMFDSMVNSDVFARG